MNYYRFTQWVSLEWAVKIARNSNFPVWIARKRKAEGHRAHLYSVLREGEDTEYFKEVMSIADAIKRNDVYQQMRG